MPSTADEVIPKHSRKEDVATLTNGMFRPLLLAGTGGVGDMWICVSNPEAASSTPMTKSLSNENGTTPLYAVKIPSKREKGYLPQEITALKHVASIPAPNNKHMQQYMCHDQLHEESTWLASQAVMGCTLWQIYKASETETIPLPKPLVLMIALQLCDALQALRGTDPPLFHEDLCHSNIMLDLETQDGNEAPTVVLIDFGRGRTQKVAPILDLDLSSFYRIVHDLATWYRDTSSGQDSKWKAFADFVASNNKSFEKRPYEDFRKEFERFGRDLLDGMSEDDRKKIDVLLGEASKIMIRARSLAESTGDQSKA